MSSGQPIDPIMRARRSFLRTSHGQRARALVDALHAWLDRRGLAVADLTSDHVAKFLARPRRVRLASGTSYVYGHLLRHYLAWLYDRGLIGFDPGHLRRHPKRLPPSAHEFIASLAPTLRPSTCIGYTWGLRRFHGWLDQHGLVLERLTRPDIGPWFQCLHAEGLHPGTRLLILMKVRSYLHWLGDRLALRTAPDDLIRPGDFPKLPSYLPRPLTREADRELQRRLAASDDPAAIGLLLMRRTGLRIGELQGLEVHCLRPDERQPLLKVPLGKLNNERLVPIDENTVELIRRLQAMPPRRRSCLLPAPDRQPMKRDRLCAALETATRGLPDPARITSHRLRHTYATEMLSAGMSLLGVMRLLGHRSYRMTLRYTAITPETVGNEYQKALAQLATKYRLPAPPALDAPPAPDQLLDRLAHWLRTHTPSGRPLRALLKRIARLEHDVRRLIPPTET